MNTVQISQIVSNDITVWFRTGLSCLISELSLIWSLKLLVSEAEISKWSKSVVQSHWNRWSETANSFTFLTCLPVKFEIPVCFAALVKKCQ